MLVIQRVIYYPACHIVFAVKNSSIQFCSRKSSHSCAVTGIPLQDTAIFETVFKQVSMPLGNIRFIRLKPQQHFLRTPCAMWCCIIILFRFSTIDGSRSYLRKLSLTDGIIDFHSSCILVNSCNGYFRRFFCIKSFLSGLIEIRICWILISHTVFCLLPIVYPFVPIIITPSILRLNQFLFIRSILCDQYNSGQILGPGIKGTVLQPFYSQTVSCIGKGQIRQLAFFALPPVICCFMFLKSHCRCGHGKFTVFSFQLCVICCLIAGTDFTCHRDVLSGQTIPASIQFPDAVCIGAPFFRTGHRQPFRKSNRIPYLKSVLFSCYCIRKISRKLITVDSRIQRIIIVSIKLRYPGTFLYDNICSAVNHYTAYCHILTQTKHCSSYGICITV